MLEVRPRLLLGSSGDAEAVFLRMRSVTKHYPRVTHVLSINNEAPHWYASLGRNRGEEEEEEEEEEVVEGEGVDVVEGGEGVKKENKGTKVGPEESKGETEGEDEGSRRRPSLETMFVQGSDQSTTDLLHHFESCCEFIKTGMEQGATLVHCEHGVSRSVTIVLAYLMWSERLPLRLLYQDLKARKPEIRPNPGFVEQLKLWGDMHCRIDDGNKAYKAYRLKCKAMEMKNSGYVGSMSLSADPSVKTQDSTAFFRCRKCRRLLFTEDSVLQHEIGKGQAAFKWHKRSKPGAASSSIMESNARGTSSSTSAENGEKEEEEENGENEMVELIGDLNQAVLEPEQDSALHKSGLCPSMDQDNVAITDSSPSPPPQSSPTKYSPSELAQVRAQVASVVAMGNQVSSQACSSYFIEPVEWMDPLIVGNLDGKISCPKCSSRLGSFNWAGEQCSCGQWVVPAFQIHRGRIDEVRTLAKRKPFRDSRD